MSCLDLHLRRRVLVGILLLPGWVREISIITIDRVGGRVSDRLLSRSVAEIGIPRGCRCVRRRVHIGRRHVGVIRVVFAVPHALGVEWSGLDAVATHTRTVRRAPQALTADPTTNGVGTTIDHRLSVDSGEATRRGVHWAVERCSPSDMAIRSRILLRRDTRANDGEAVRRRLMMLFVRVLRRQRAHFGATSGHRGSRGGDCRGGGRNERIWRRP